MHVSQHKSLSSEVCIACVLALAMAAPAWVGKVKALVDDVSMAINQKASRAVSVLVEAGLAYTAKLRPRDILVHPSNRGGQMVNPFDVSAKGQAICEVGWDCKKIREPVCVELPLDAAQRHSIVEANKNLSDQSNGMLAKPTGKERCCSISASHTTSFLKALEAGCQLGGDHLSLEKLSAKQDDLQELLQQGWEWTVISAKVEEEIPHLPAFLQQAYNSNLLAISWCLCQNLFSDCKQCMFPTCPFQVTTAS